MKCFCRLLITCCLLVASLRTARPATRPLASIPAEIASEHFVVTIDGQRTPVMHAALNLYFLNFAARPHARVTVTAASDTFWSQGVEIEPWRLNLRPERSGRTLSFRLDGEAKLTIKRPGDFGSNAEMLYLFANPAEAGIFSAQTPGLRYYGPGVHHENIDAAEGDHIYLAEGAVIFGSLNIWQVDHVSVSGRGVIVYDGPQNPADDDGWMHKKNWHCIVMDNAHDIHIEGLTCVVRSRTWQIQMKDSRGIVFDNIKVIGANSSNANADGMDWLGGGDTVVRNSFFRAADDIFALQTSWNGYGPVAFADQGQPVTNITVEHSTLSTSISNIVRAGWPEKNFEGGNFTLRDSDVLHMGLGGCGIPFALMELWADPDGRGRSSGFTFQNIRMENWYSLVQVMEPVDGVHDISFQDIAGLEAPSLVPSILKGQVSNVQLDGIAIAGEAIRTAAELPLQPTDGASAASLVNTLPVFHIRKGEGLIRPRQKVSFEAVSSDSKTSGLNYTWRFGDGRQATGRKTSHKFPDTQGTLLDDSGRFRILLEITDRTGRHQWLDAPVIVTDSLRPAQPAKPSVPGLTYTYSSSKDQSRITGTAATLALADIAHAPANYTVDWSGDLEVPTAGGYTFMLIAGEEAMLEIDGETLVRNQAPIAQVCGLAGMAAQALPAYVAMASGRHHLRVSETHGVGDDPFRLLWKGPGIPFQPLPAVALSHVRVTGPTP